MSTTASRCPSKLMRVTLYRVENDPSLLTCRGEGESLFRLALRLRRLAWSEIHSDSDVSAAAQVYYDEVGRYRVQRMQKIGAPPAMIAAESDPKRIETELKELWFLHERVFVMDNACEAWLMTVDCNWHQGSRLGFHGSAGGANA